MKLEANPATTTTKPGTGTRAEAARYGLLRRLAPTLKHDMVVNLQAISMMAEVLGARLERGSSEPVDFQASIAKLNRLARDAVMNSLKVAAWIEPGEDETILLEEGVDECLAVLANNFSFRNFAVVKELPRTEFPVWRASLRSLLVACLIYMTDTATGPCQVRIKAEVVDGFAELSVQMHERHDKVEGQPLEPAYRQLEWLDVQSLAMAESVELVRSPQRVVIRMPRAVATTPVRIAPV